MPVRTATYVPEGLATKMMLHGFVTIFLSVLGSTGQAPITAAVFTPDGNQIMLGSQAGIQIRSWPDLKVVNRLKIGVSHVHDLAFSPDGKTLLAAGGSPAEEGAVEMLRWPDLKKVDRVAPHKELIYRVAWSPDGKHWASASGDGTCRVFGAATRKLVTTYEGHSRAVLAITYLPDGKSIVSAGGDQTLQVWDAATGKTIRILDNHVAAVNDIAVRPRMKSDAGPLLVSVSDDRTVRLWQPDTGRMVRFAKLKSPPRTVAWSPDGARLLAGCDDGRLRVLDPDTLEVVSDHPGLEGRIHTLTPHPKTAHAFLGGAGFLKLGWR